MEPLSRLLLAALLAASPAAAQIKVVPEVAAPVGGGLAGAGARTVNAPAPAPTLASPVLPSAPPTATPTSPSVAASPAVALPAAAVPAAQAASVRPAAAASLALPASPQPDAAPTKGLEGVKQRTAEMTELMGREGGGAQAGIEASGIATGLFDGGLKGKAANGVADSGANTEGYGEAGVGSGGAFLQALSRGGIPTASLGKLAELLKTGHPGDQTQVYHGLSHSLRVANVALAVLDGPAGRGMSPQARNTLLVAAALHDYDPSRPAGSPARVSATLETLDKDPKASALMKGLAAAGVDPAQVKALIKYTDFHPDPAVRAQIRTDADSLSAAAFVGADALAWAKLWGPRLAFVDQSAMYVDSPAFARQAVVGLANELNAPADKVLAGTHNFLKPLIESPDFALLPPALQANFRAVHRYFVTLSQAAPAAPAAGAAEARAPPAGDPLAALSRLSDALSSEANRSQASTDPKYYPAVLDQLTSQLKAWQASPRAVKAKAAGGIENLSRTQQDLKAKLLAAAREFLKSKTDGVRPIKEEDVITSGTGFEALLGMLFTGGLEATNPYQGFKGESAHYWGAKGLAVGAQYGAGRAVNRNEPGVMLLIHNAKDPIKVVGGETLSRRPVVGADIFAAVVTDGESTFVLQGPALTALAASSARWKDFVVAEARAGRMAPFDSWERVQSRFTPR